MTTPYPGNGPGEGRLRALLQTAAPSLLSPPDRIEAVAGRVRRARRRRYAIESLAVAAMISLAAAALPWPGRSAPAATFGADGCPVSGSTPEPYAFTSRGGALVARGASRVTLCELVIDAAAARLDDPRAGEPRTVLTGVAAIVDRLNTLPPMTEPDEPRGCTAVAHPTLLAFVVSYANRPPTVIWLDRNCNSLTSSGRSRTGAVEALDIFHAAYRDQLSAAATPADLAARPCPTTLRPDDFDRSTRAGEGVDEVARNRSVLEPILPRAVVAATACRYSISTTAVRLVTARPVAAGQYGTIQSAVIRQFADPTYLGTDCGEPVAAAAPTLVDDLRIVDDTGALLEVRVVRAPCTAAMVRGRGALELAPALGESLDAILGKP